MGKKGKRKKKKEGLLCLSNKVFNLENLLLSKRKEKKKMNKSTENTVKMVSGENGGIKVDSRYC